MDQKKLIKKIARLESLNDQLTAEIAYLDALTKKLGFEEGIKTLKEAGKELLQEMENDKDSPPLAG